MKRKIRHALVSYTVTTEDGRTSYETAFRNQIVDIPDDQVERLDDIGATVAPDVDLERPGKMNTLPDSASDGEITNWVIGATNAEVEQLVKERPAMADRIIAAHAAVAERFSEQNIHLGGLKEIAEQAEEEAKLADLEFLSEEELAVLEELKGLSEDEVLELALAKEDLIGGGEGEGEDDFDADAIVAGTAKEAADFISENPQHAQAILDAEARRSERTKEDVRVTIVRAAEAAAGFTAS